MTTLLTKKRLKNQKNSVSSGFMPTSSKDIEELQKRSILISKKITTSSENKNEVNYINFRLGKSEIYGIPYEYAKEVMNKTLLTTIPRVPRFIAGVINRRGALIAVLDLKQFFHIEPAEYDEQACIIVVEHHGMTLGILVDKIEGNETYDPLTLDATLPSEGITKLEYILGLHQGRVAIINIESIMNDPQLLINKG
ncbi:MAG: chemotaxis protein CheW [Gammaproteobacteria bacterium]|nr:chemotaxis protein CheW [Gammaproteobacteria bacterium]